MAKSYFNHNHPNSNGVLTAIMVLSLTHNTEEIAEELMTCKPDSFLGHQVQIINTRWEIDFNQKDEVIIFVERAIEYIRDCELFLKVSPTGNYPLYRPS